MVKDFLGNELAVGDVVVHYEEKGAGFRLARVIGFTPKRVNLRSIFNNTDVDDEYLRTSKLELRLIRASDQMREMSDQAVFDHFARARQEEV